MTQHHPALTYHHEVFVPLTDAGCITSVPNLALAGLDVPSWVWAPESNRAWDVASAVAVAWYYGPKSDGVTARVRAWVRALDDDTVDLLVEAALRMPTTVVRAYQTERLNYNAEFRARIADWLAGDRRWHDAETQRLEHVRLYLEYCRISLPAVARLFEDRHPGLTGLTLSAITESEMDLLGACNRAGRGSKAVEPPWLEEVLDAGGPDWLLMPLLTPYERDALAAHLVANRYEQTGGGPPAEADAEPDATSADATKDGDE